MRISDWSSDVCSSDLRLAERRATIAGNLSGGEHQMLAIGAALLTQPRILINDEPTLGLAVPVIEALCEKLSQRSEERRVGKECVITCRCRWSRSHEKKKMNAEKNIDRTGKNEY